MKLIVNKTLSGMSGYGGGVGGYYRTIRKYTKEFDYLDATYSIKKNSFLRFLKEFAKAQIKFLGLQRKSTVTIYNPSLGGYSWFRDLIQMRILSRGKGKRVIFFRGWDESFAKKVDKNVFYNKMFFFVYGKKADAFIVLSSTFENYLRRWGIEKPIYIESTIVDEELIAHYHNEIQAKEFNKDFKVLFLSRIEREKGVFDLVKAFKILSAQCNKSVTLELAGNGTSYYALEEAVKNELGINTHGFVTGNSKTDLINSSQLFVFPSSHGEGMPNAVLEAMAFGLPVLTTRVGGIPDFFEEGKMGLFLDNTEPEHIAERIQYLLERPELMKTMSCYNYEYAKEHFYASKVARRLEKIIDEVCA